LIERRGGLLEAPAQASNRGEVKTPTREIDVWGTQAYFQSADRATRLVPSIHDASHHFIYHILIFIFTVLVSKLVRGEKRGEEECRTTKEKSTTAPLQTKGMRHPRLFQPQPVGHPAHGAPDLTSHLGTEPPATHDPRSPRRQRTVDAEHHPGKRFAAARSCWPLTSTVLDPCLSNARCPTKEIDFCFGTSMRTTVRP
jgi:hypothetical protein